MRWSVPSTSISADQLIAINLIICNACCGCVDIHSAMSSFYGLHLLVVPLLGLFFISFFHIHVTESIVRSSVLGINLDALQVTLNGRIIVFLLEVHISQRIQTQTVIGVDLQALFKLLCSLVVVTLEGVDSCHSTASLKMGGINFETLTEPLD